MERTPRGYVELWVKDGAMQGRSARKGDPNFTQNTIVGVIAPTRTNEDQHGYMMKV